MAQKKPVGKALLNRQLRYRSFYYDDVSVARQRGLDAYYKDIPRAHKRWMSYYEKNRRALLDRRLEIFELDKQEVPNHFKVFDADKNRTHHVKVVILED